MCSLIKHFPIQAQTYHFYTNRPDERAHEIANQGNSKDTRHPINTQRRSEDIYNRMDEQADSS